jgi:phenylalanyl-tRNA synthetase alpha chain
VGENLNLRHLMGYLEVFGKEVAGAEKIRFRPGYFPFTEPSLEMDGYVNGKWVELVGSGIFRPEVTQPLGIDKPVLAWGVGFARLAMIKMGITDIRDLFNHDLEWLRTRKVVM